MSADYLAFHRLDLAGAVILDHLPRFPLPMEMRQFMNPGQGQDVFMPTLWTLPLYPRTSQSLVCIVEVLSAVAAAVNLHGHQQQLRKDDIGAVKLLGPATHLLLSIPRPSDNYVVEIGSDLTAVGEMARLSGLIFLASLKSRFSMVTMELNLLQGRFSNWLGWSFDRLGQDLRDLALWALVTAALFRDRDGRALCVAKIWDILAVSDLVDGGSVISLVRGMVWVEEVEARGAKELRREIDAFREL